MNFKSLSTLIALTLNKYLASSATWQSSTCFDDDFVPFSFIHSCCIQSAWSNLKDWRNLEYQKNLKESSKNLRRRILKIAEIHQGKWEGSQGHDKAIPKASQKDSQKESEKESHKESRKDLRRRILKMAEIRRAEMGGIPGPRQSHPQSISKRIPKRKNPDDATNRITARKLPVNPKTNWNLQVPTRQILQESLSNLFRISDECRDRIPIENNCRSQRWINESNQWKTSCLHTEAKEREKERERERKRERERERERASSSSRCIIKDIAS